MQNSASVTNEDASIPQAADKNSMQKFLIHKGRSADMIRRSPAISGVSLCRSWTDAATKDFIRAIRQVGTSCLLFHSITRLQIVVLENTQYD